MNKHISFDQFNEADIIFKDGTTKRITIKEYFANESKYHDCTIKCPYCGAISYPRRDYKRNVTTYVSSCFYALNHDKSCRHYKEKSKFKSVTEIKDYEIDNDYLLSDVSATRTKGGRGGGGFGPGSTDDEEDTRKPILVGKTKKAKNSIDALQIAINKLHEKDDKYITLVLNNETIKHDLSSTDDLSGTHVIVVEQTNPSNFDIKIDRYKKVVTFRDVFTRKKPHAIFIQINMHESKFNENIKGPWDLIEKMKGKYAVIYGEFIRNEEYPNMQVYKVKVNKKTFKIITKSEYEDLMNELNHY